MVQYTSNLVHEKVILRVVGRMRKIRSSNPGRDKPVNGSEGSTVKRSTAGMNITGSQRWYPPPGSPLPCLSKLANLHRKWWYNIQLYELSWCYKDRLKAKLLSVYNDSQQACVGVCQHRDMKGSWEIDVVSFESWFVGSFWLHANVHCKFVSKIQIKKKNPWCTFLWNIR